MHQKNSLTYRGLIAYRKLRLQVLLVHSLRTADNRARYREQLGVLCALMNPKVLFEVTPIDKGQTVRYGTKLKYLNGLLTIAKNEKLYNIHKGGSQ